MFDWFKQEIHERNPGFKESKPPQIRFLDSVKRTSPVLGGLGAVLVVPGLIAISNDPDAGTVEFVLMVCSGFCITIAIIGWALGSSIVPETKYEHPENRYGIVALGHNRPVHLKRDALFLMLAWAGTGLFTLGAICCGLTAIYLSIA